MSNTAQHWKATRPLLIGSLAIATLIGTLGIWGTQTKIAGAIIASGMIQVESNRQVIQHPEGGVVGAILAQDGDHVTAGQVVLRFDDRLLRSELSILENQLAEIQARSLRLRAERDNAPDITPPLELSPKARQLLQGQRQLFLARKETLTREQEQISEQIAQSQNQITGIEAQLTALTTQEALIAQELQDAESLRAKGLMQASRVLALQREQAGLKGEIGRLTATIAQIKGQIAALDIQALKLSTARREEAIAELRDLSTQEIELQERALSTRETLRRMEVRAPVAGVIHGSEVFALQAVVSPAQPIMYVIPQDQAMVVQARIESIHIDQVHVGQEASLRFSAFDQRQTPELFGSVTKVSADVFTDEVTGMSYYAAELLPKTGELTKLGGQTLLPGMPVETYIKTTERTPMSYLIKPLADYFNKALREE